MQTENASADTKYYRLKEPHRKEHDIKMGSQTKIVLQGSLGKPAAFGNLPPEKGVVTYIESLQNKNLGQVSKYRSEFRGGCKYLTMRSLVNEKEWTEWLRSVKDNASERRSVMDKNWEILRMQEQHLHQSFDKYDRFVRENEEKRKRNKQRLKNLQEVQIVQNKKMEELREKYSKTLEIKELLEEMVNKHSIYENYLNSVVAVGNEFKRPFDLVARYEALLEAKYIIKNRQEELHKLTENARNEYRRKHNTNKLKLVGLMNKVSDLYTRHEQAKYKAIKWEIQVNVISHEAMKIKTAYLEVKSAALNIYKGCCERKKCQKTFKDGDVKAQLVFIRKAIKDLQGILDLFRDSFDLGKDLL